MTPVLEFPTQNEPGLWFRRQTRQDFSNRPALFLDRDGVLVEEINYLHRIEDCRIIDGAAKTIRRANELNVPVIIVTNQSGVGRGYYDWDQFGALQDFIAAELHQDGAQIDLVLACAYHPAGQPPYDKTNHKWRKPRSGMLHAAAKALGLDLNSSWLIGDSASDIDAARQAGLAGALHVLTGHGERDRAALNLGNTLGFSLRAIDSINDTPTDLY
ncbi:MAG: D-glycero-alpha-D-manno-heptose-1,7-bisphosphate 7-phosphatase [Alphaproteobacteria bacterium]